VSQDQVRVFESSAAELPHLWLNVTGEAFLEEPPRQIASLPHGAARASVSAHLTLEQAAAIRDLLDAAIAGHYHLEETEPDACGRLLVGQGDDTYDPCCGLPERHDGACRP
jgi:hypothetical protein